MIKLLTSLAIIALLGVSVLALPGFAPRAGAAETPVSGNSVSTHPVLAKGDKLEIGPVAGKCTQQVWPNFDASCLRNADSSASVREVRLVTGR